MTPTAYALMENGEFRHAYRKRRDAALIIERMEIGYIEPVFTLAQIREDLHEHFVAEATAKGLTPSQTQSEWEMSDQKQWLESQTWGIAS